MMIIIEGHVLTKQPLTLVNLPLVTYEEVFQEKDTSS